MGKTHLERSTFAGQRPTPDRSAGRARRRASLLLGAGFLLHTSPAWAANECGPPPPGGGTVTCEGGVYPNGIQYFSTGPLRVVLKEGFLTRRNSTIEALGGVTVEPADGAITQFASETPGPVYNDALRILADGPVVLRTALLQSIVAGGGGGYIEFEGSADVRVDSVFTFNVNSPGLVLREGFSPALPPSKVRVAAGVVSTSGSGSPGIVVFGGGDEIRIEPLASNLTVLTEGPDSDGIRAFTSGPGSDAIISATLVRTRGDRSIGVRAAADSILLNLASVQTSGADSPAIEASGTSAVVINSGNVTTAGVRSAGIRAFSERGRTTISSGSILTTGRSIGIEAYSSGGDVNITSNSIVTQGAGTRFQEGAGIFVDNPGGNVSITSGSITTAGTQAFGIRVFGRAVSITTNSIATTGRLANGIFASSSGSIAVTSGPIVTSGDSASGVVTFLTGSGATSIRTGNISTQGIDSYGVIATTAGTGPIDVTGDGTIVTTGGGSPGISAESGGPVTVSANNISASGTNSDAIAVRGSTSAVTIRGLVQSSQGFAVRGEGGLRQGSGPGGPVTATIAAGGTLRGRVSLTGGADRVFNNGIFDAIATSQFGAGADLFDNNAGGTVRSVNGAATFAGLETFNNRGTIEMRDGATNDSLTLPGTYFGAGAARLGLDVDFGAGTADRLITGAATGSMAIEIQGTGGARFTPGILLVDAGPGTSPTAFSLVGASNSPYLQSSLRFDAANSDFLLVQLPGVAVFETSRLGGMATRLWYESADAVAAQLDTVRDGRKGRGMSLWLQGWAGEHERHGTQSFPGAGTFDVSFRQNFQGVQGGVDLRRGGGVAGITAGAGRSDATFASGNPVDLNVKNIGLYAQGRIGPFWANALAKKDWIEMDIAPGAGFGAEFDGDLVGLQANAGLRLESGALFAEPSVGLSWVHADLDSFQSGAATVEPGIAESARARAGLRAGARLPLGGGDLLPFAAIDLYEELDDGNETAFTLGETLRLFEEPAGTRGQAAAGLSFVTPGFEAFIRGEMDFSGDTDAKALRVGARLRF